MPLYRQVRGLLVAAIALIAVGCLLFPPSAQARRHRGAAAPATLQHVVVNEKSGAPSNATHLEIELDLSHAVKPRFSRLTEPDRLIVDLPQTEPPDPKPLLHVGRMGVRSVRASLFRNRPPTTRVVVDMDSALPYDWHAEGSRIFLEIGAAKSAANSTTPAQKITISTPPPTLASNSTSSTKFPSTVPSPTSSGIAAGIPGGGSTLTAGSDTAVLQLARGGEVRVCPGTTVAVTQGSNGLTLGLNVGALEVHYHLNAGADVVLTPDFRFQLTSPGDFHVAMSADAKGNTCIRGLDGNNVPVAVTELLDDSAYLVRPREQIVFRAGSLANVAFEVPAGCGCPAPAPLNQLASGAPQGGMQISGATSQPAPENAVNTPLVFRGGKAGEAPNAAVLASLPVIARQAPSGWSLLDLPHPELAQDAANKPSRQNPGLFARVKRYFTGWFKSQ